MAAVYDALAERSGERLEMLLDIYHAAWKGAEEKEKRRERERERESR